jgi:hypothetical protein
MPSNQDYENDVFISYKREDYGWALKLHDSLTAKGFRVFLDVKRLEAGLDWQRQLLQQLHSSQHLIALWSTATLSSEWVRREVYNFDAQRTLLQKSGPDNRRMFFILLEMGDAPPFPDTQMINDIQQANVYTAGADQVSPNLWMDIIARIEQPLRNDDPSNPILLAVLAMTRDRLTKLDPLISPPGGVACLKALLQKLEVQSIQTKDDLANYYGDRPEDWHPFGSHQSIRMLMEDLKNEINHYMPASPIRWEPIGNDLWSDTFEIAQREAFRLAQDWCVIVIDPLSFYDQDIAYRFNNYIYPSFENPKAVFMALPPFNILSPYLHFRSTLEHMATRVFHHHYSPPLHTFHSYARCNINIGDRRDIKQWLLTTVGLGLSTEQLNTVPAVLRT